MTLFDLLPVLNLSKANLKEKKNIEKNKKVTIKFESVINAFLMKEPKEYVLQNLKEKSLKPLKGKFYSPGRFQNKSRKQGTDENVPQNKLHEKELIDNKIQNFFTISKYKKDQIQKEKDYTYISLEDSTMIIINKCYLQTLNSKNVSSTIIKSPTLENSIINQEVVYIPDLSKKSFKQREKFFLTLKRTSREKNLSKKNKTDFLLDLDKKKVSITNTKNNQEINFLNKKSNNIKKLKKEEVPILKEVPISKPDSLSTRKENKYFFKYEKYIDYTKTKNLHSEILIKDFNSRSKSVVLRLESHVNNISKNSLQNFSEKSKKFEIYYKNITRRKESFPKIFKKLSILNNKLLTKEKEKEIESSIKINNSGTELFHILNKDNRESKREDLSFQNFSLQDDSHIDKKQTIKHSTTHFIPSSSTENESSMDRNQAEQENFSKFYSENNQNFLKDINSQFRLTLRDFSLNANLHKNTINISLNFLNDLNIDSSFIEEIQNIIKSSGLNPGKIKLKVKGKFVYEGRNEKTSALDVRV
ncbi:hypothetical protein Dester_1227 [Desulfurobacterium thermolithotrophum DSM 11699]|uniref:Uncharacterized protein n=1 Tax=Desulfurobacterium thermolithotrophum (strain DSM 11699 / BSA) TaxID=868864 RepID=F0S0R0_DESTD|nr:hypothetical protein [Desulfurobacterium thermolithotrophum]ADY73863.1 hypothetical protein Dester_1227 [Desulfurobacterium thermolithotrophum DSM 11699]